MAEKKWIKIGDAAKLKGKEIQGLVIESVAIALSYRDGKFGAISGTCLHMGGPLGQGKIENDYVVCPWHSWMFHRMTGEARPGIPAAVPRYELKEENGQLWINLTALTEAKHAHHPAHPLTRSTERKPGPLRVAGIATTAMNQAHPRYSTSDDLLERALRHSAQKHGAETKLIKLRELQFRECEGYYSIHAAACSWPCTITQMDSTDQLEQVYDAFVHWADVVLIATPIRWGNASSLYYKMVERMNCIQNQITVADKVLIQNKTAGFIITGGQDNIQAVAGQMLTFFGEIGFEFPAFPFVGHSLGWSAEDMEKNTDFVQQNAELEKHVQELADRCIEKASRLMKR